MTLGRLENTRKVGEIYCGCKERSDRRREEEVLQLEGVIVRVECHIRQYFWNQILPYLDNLMSSACSIRRRELWKQPRPIFNQESTRPLPCSRHSVDRFADSIVRTRHHHFTAKVGTRYIYTRRAHISTPYPP
jgi:hypothetical protein